LIHDTKDEAYTNRLAKKSQSIWKNIFNVQAPYRFNLKRLDLGRVLDIGCGIGRNLANLDGNAVGIDHNVHSVEFSRSRGFEAYSPDEFFKKYGKSGQFDSILVSHVLEHMDQKSALSLLAEYLPVLRTSGRVVLITPQELGFRSDPTHVEYMNFAKLSDIAREAGLRVIDQYSFPFPKFCGWFFKHNEHVVIAKKP
jgi:2-polyprenyl-3-methyl-5-hydroxy-6-metoxy-1,4-benzoquinol methylase